MNEADFWLDVLQKIRNKISESSYHTWLSGTSASIHDNVLTVMATNEFAADWLRERYQPIIFDTVKECAGKTFDIEFTHPGNVSLDWIPVESKKSVQLEKFIRECIEKYTKELTEIIKDHEERIRELEEMLQFEETYHTFIPYEDEAEPKKVCYDIDGYIEVDVDVDEETFYSEFQDWLDSKGWSFVSLQKESKE